jgi:hypothetical protein
MARVLPKSLHTRSDRREARARHARNKQSVCLPKDVGQNTQYNTRNLTVRCWPGIGDCQLQAFPKGDIDVTQRDA